jgi:hypothetical protein
MALETRSLVTGGSCYSMHFRYVLTKVLRYSDLQVRTSRAHICHAWGRMALIPEFGSFH